MEKKCFRELYISNNVDLQQSFISETLEGSQLNYCFQPGNNLLENH